MVLMFVVYVTLEFPFSSISHEIRVIHTGAYLMFVVYGFNVCGSWFMVLMIVVYGFNVCGLCDFRISIFIHFT